MQLNFQTLLLITISVLDALVKDKYTLFYLLSRYKMICGTESDLVFCSIYQLTVILLESTQLLYLKKKKNWSVCALITLLSLLLAFPDRFSNFLYPKLAGITMVSIVKVCWGIRLLMLEIELLGTCFWRHGCSPRIYPAFHTACPRFVDICEAGTINMLSGRSFAYKGPYVKAMAFPVIMYGCESWNIKKAEHQRVDAFELWCWRRLLRVPWTARRSNQSILKEISLEYSLEGLILTLKL